MTLRFVGQKCFTVFCLATLVVAAAGCNATSKPTPALMLVGGNYHDYDRLPVALADRLNGRGDVHIDVTDDLSSINADALEPYRVLVVNTCHRPELTDAFKDAITGFVKSGNGLVVVHCSLWSYEDWPEWTRMIGGYVETHDKHGPYEVVVLDPWHATMLGLGNRFTVIDEPYFVDRRAPDNLVLIETARAHSDQAGKPRGGPDPQVWVRHHGKGRIFVTTFGHDEVIQQSDEFITHLHSGIRWAAGALEDTRHNVLHKSERQAGYKLLFNGRDLSGWKCDPSLWSVENGEIVGQSDNLPRDSFLVHEGSFDDFVLQFSFRVVDGNSGVQVHSAVQTAADPRPMIGPHVELSPGLWGSIFQYGGGERNQTGGLPVEHADAVVDRGWNACTIVATGKRVISYINGLKTACYEPADGVRHGGRIGLQLHAGEPNEIRLRDLRIRRGPPQFPPEPDRPPAGAR